MQNIPITTALDEETARAELYGVLAALFASAPTKNVLEALRQAPTQAPRPGAFLESAWTDLVGLSKRMSDEQISNEYEALFGGVGRPEVLLFGSHYLTGFLNEKPLVALRDDLQALGLERQTGVHNTEDHIAYLCEVMRYLIAGEDVSVANLTRQRAFFIKHIQPWVEQMCDAIVAHPKAAFYATTSKLLQQFVQVETQGFDMLV
jgi:TorA maturation chaperone TorD